MAAGPTELRLALIALTSAMLVMGGGPRLLGPFSTYDLLVGTAGVVLLILFMAQTILTGRRIAATEHDPES